jgi:hypothetical protein
VTAAKCFYKRGLDSGRRRQRMHLGFELLKTQRHVALALNQQRALLTRRRVLV